MSQHSRTAPDTADPDPAGRASWPPEIRLGSDIVRNLAWMDRDARTEAVATHLRKFWDPRMRRALALRVREGDPRIDPTLGEAVIRYFQNDIDHAEIAEPSGG